MGDVPSSRSRGARPARVARTLVLTLASLALWGIAGELRAQESTGSLAGIVLDSTVMAPLGDAAVFLWDTPHRGSTSADGTFVLEGLPPGRYTVVFFHSRLGELGISAGPLPVEIRSGDTTRVELATPSTHTLLATGCALDPNRGGVVVGQALDGASGTALPGVKVRFEWTGDGDPTPESREVRTDSDGWYQACDLPGDRRVAVTSGFLDRASLRREIRLDRGPAYVDLALEELAFTDVDGRLVDAESGEGVPDATLVLVGTGFRTSTGNDGRFRFRGVLPGEYTLRSGHLAYETRNDPLELVSGVRVQVEVQVSRQALELPPLIVTVEAESLSQRAMGGTVLSRAMLDDVRPRSRDVLDLLSNTSVPGLVIRRQGGRTCVGFVTGQVRMSYRGPCVPAVVFIDNVRAADPNMAVDIPAEVVDRIVLYRPIEAGNLFGLGSGNGVLMIFTKRR